MRHIHPTTMRPPLPMYAPPPSPAVADAWHQTAAPGGHESWRVTFSDPSTRTHVVATLTAGCPFHPDYLDQYAHYRRNPTAVPPPLPSRWPIAHLIVFRDDRPLLESLTRLPPEHFLASTSLLDLTVGLNRLVRTPDAVHLAFRGRLLTRGPLGRVRHPKGALVHLDLTLYTITPPLPPHPYHDAHHLFATVAAPCTAKGQFQLRLDSTSQPQTIPLAGRASVEHDLATRPLSDSFTTHLAGTAFLPHSVLPIRVACTQRPSETVISLFDDDGQPQAIPSASARTSWTQSKRPHPISIDASPFVRLDSPQILPATGPLTHLLYRATTPDNQTGHAILQLIHPPDVPGRVAKMFLTPKLATPAMTK